KTEKRGLPINVPTLEVLGGIIKLQDHLKLTDTKDASGNQYYEIPWIAEAISSLYKFGVSAAAILAVIMIIVGGFIWLTSAGNQTQITEAKGYIFGAAIGLLIALGSYVLLYTINPELVRLKPIKIPYVEHEDLLTITSEENQQPDDGGGGNASSYSGGQNNGMRYYNQGDEGDIPGFHKWGCACSSVAMAISKFGGNLTPTGCAHKYIKPPENMNIPGKRIIDVSSALKDNKLQVEKVESLGDAKTRITAAIKNGSVIIALIKSGSTGHYLIIANADDIGVSLLDPGRRSNTGCTWNELISGIPGDKSRRPLRSYYIISK
ncbi:MAG: pilin, partial [Patescibacteria group bacterium]